MKEATGDLNMTVVIVLIVAVMGAFFSMVVAPLILNGIKSETNCSDAICTCTKTEITGGSCSKCYLKGKENQKFTCPYKG